MIPLIFLQIHSRASFGIIFIKKLNVFDIIIKLFTNYFYYYAYYLKIILFFRTNPTYCRFPSMFIYNRTKAKLIVMG